MSGWGFSLFAYNNDNGKCEKKEDMANASAIYNLLRNLGGSFGVAFITTMIARRAQFHQVRIIGTSYAI